MTTDEKAIAPTSSDYAIGYAEGFNDACKPSSPDCRTCKFFGGCSYNNWKRIERRCTNGDQYQPAPKVVLWRKK